MRIRAAVTPALHAPMVVEDADLDDPGPGEALVRIVASGLCHTDAITRAGDLPMPLPGNLGHEGSGIVAAVGDGVTAVRPGDAVVMGWPMCGECRNCLDGEPRYCARAQGRFPFHELARLYALDEVEQALADSARGEVLKPVVLMPDA